MVSTGVPLKCSQSQTLVSSLAHLTASMGEPGPRLTSRLLWNSVCFLRTNPDALSSLASDSVSEADALLPSLYTLGSAMVPVQCRD